MNNAHEDLVELGMPHQHVDFSSENKEKLDNQLDGIIKNIRACSGNALCGSWTDFTEIMTGMSYPYFLNRINPRDPNIAADLVQEFLRNTSRAVTHGKFSTEHVGSRRNYFYTCMKHILKHYLSDVARERGQHSIDDARDIPFAHSIPQSRRWPMKHRTHNLDAVVVHDVKTQTPRSIAAEDEINDLLQKELAEAISSLKPHQRAIFEARLFEGRPLEEIAHLPWIVSLLPFVSRTGATEVSRENINKIFKVAVESVRQHLINHPALYDRFEDIINGLPVGKRSNRAYVIQAFSRPNGENYIYYAER